MKRSNLRPIWSMFTVFLSLFILNFAVSIPLGGTQRMWLLLELWSLLLSGALLTRYGMPDRKKRVLSASLALLACLGHALVYKALLSAIWSFLLTLTAALAVFSTFSHFAEQEIPLLRVGKGSECALSVGVGLAVGALLGAVNLFLGGGRSAQGFHPVVPALLVALNPAIYGRGRPANRIFRILSSPDAGTMCNEESTFHRSVHDGRAARAHSHAGSLYAGRNDRRARFNLDLCRAFWASLCAFAAQARPRVRHDCARNGGSDPLLPARAAAVET